MRIEIQQPVFAALLSQLVTVADQKTTMLQLNHIHLVAQNPDASCPNPSADDQLILSATDLETGLQFIESNVVVEKPGEALLPGKKLYEIIKELPGTDRPVVITVEPSTYRATITCGQSTFQLAGLDPNERPSWLEEIPASMDRLDRDTMMVLIGTTLYAASHDANRFNLNSINLLRCSELTLYPDSMPELCAIATDGHRLAKSFMQTNNRDEAIDPVGTPVPTPTPLALLPRKGADQLRKFLEKMPNGESTAYFGVTESKKNLVTRYVDDKGSQTATLSIRLFDGTYPDTDRLIPNNPVAIVRIEREALLKSLKRVKLLTGDNNKGVTLRFANNTLELKSRHADIGEAHDKVGVVFAGDAFQLIMNVEYLKEAIEHIGAEYVSFEYYGETIPVILRGAPKRVDEKKGTEPEGDTAETSTENTETVADGKPVSTPSPVSFHLVMPMRK